MQLEIKWQETIPIPAPVGKGTGSFPQREKRDLSSQEDILHSLHGQGPKIGLG